MPPGRVDRGPEDPGSSPALGQHVPGTKVIGSKTPTIRLSSAAVTPAM